MKLIRLYRFFPYILTAFVFIFTSWSVWFQIHQPSLDFSLTLTTSNIISTNSDIPSDIQTGDSILSIDGVPIEKVLNFPGKNVGEHQYLIVERDGITFPVDLLLQKPSAFDLFERLSPIFVALLFLILGIGVYSFLQIEGSSTIFFIYCTGLCIILVAGADSAFGLPLARKIFGIMLWWIGPLALHTHFQLVSSNKSRHVYTRLPIFYGIALFLCAIYLWPVSYPFSQVKNVLFYVEYLWLAINLFILIIALLRVHRRTETLEIRRKIGIIFFSFIIGITPFLILSLLPELLFSQVILPYEISFIFLITIPAGYGLAILRYKVIVLDRYVSRTTSKVLLALIIVSLYGFIYLIVPRLFPYASWDILFTGLTITFLLVFTYQPLSMHLSHFVDRILYGGWYDEKEIIKHLHITLNQASSGPDEIAESLCQALQKTLQLEYVNFLFPNGKLFTTQNEKKQSSPNLLLIPEDTAISMFSQLNRLSSHGMGDSRILSEVIDIKVDAKQNIFGERPQLWLLLKNQTDDLGLLILGNRRGGEFDQLDLSTLEVITRQASYALDNAILLAQVRQHARKVQALNAQMTISLEEERKRLARELHDQILQSVYGFSYYLSNLKSELPISHKGEVDILRKELLNTFERVRDICSELRPPALDSQGLAAAIRDHIRKTSKAVGLNITFVVNEDELPPISPQVSIILYRILQESLGNIQKHAFAQKVQVSLGIRENELILIVVDDGKGFIVPEHLEQFTTAEHYGLAGIQERLSPVNGHLEIHSTPGEGCQIVVSIPIELSPAIESFDLEEINVSSPDHRG